MRRWLDRAFLVGTGGCAVLALTVLLGILAAVVWRGAGAVSWEFLTDGMRQVGASGGIFYNVIGTGILLATALLVSAPLAVGLALTLGVYVRNSRRRNRLVMMLYLLNGVPSILIGLFGFVIFGVLLGWGKSWLAGGILLGFMILPTVAVALFERIQALPANTTEAAAGLGLSESQIIWSVILPQSLSGWLSGSLLGLARAAGETAPIMFTATIFAGATWPQGIRESPVLSLPYHIFVLAQDSFDPAASVRVWGAALILLFLVFSLSLLALPLRLRLHEESRHD
jgi:phosphate transport system permease protein